MCARGLQSTPLQTGDPRSSRRRISFRMKQLPVAEGTRTCRSATSWGETRKRENDGVEESDTFHILEVTLTKRNCFTRAILAPIATHLSKCRLCPGACFSTREGYIQGGTATCRKLETPSRYSRGPVCQLLWCTSTLSNKPKYGSE